MNALTPVELLKEAAAGIIAIATTNSDPTRQRLAIELAQKVPAWITVQDQQCRAEKLQEDLSAASEHLEAAHQAIIEAYKAGDDFISWRNVLRYFAETQPALLNELNAIDEQYKAVTA